MKNLLKPLLAVAALLFLSGISASAQSSESPGRNALIVGAGKTVKLLGKGAVIVGDKAASASWEAAKFTGKEIALPLAGKVAKPLIVKAAPKAGMFLLKSSGMAIKKGVPLASKLIVSYLKYKLPI